MTERERLILRARAKAKAERERGEQQDTFPTAEELGTRAEETNIALKYLDAFGGALRSIPPTITGDLPLKHPLRTLLHPYTPEGMVKPAVGPSGQELLKWAAGGGWPVLETGSGRFLRGAPKEVHTDATAILGPLVEMLDPSVATGVGRKALKGTAGEIANLIDAAVNPISRGLEKGMGKIYRSGLKATEVPKGLEKPRIEELVDTAESLNLHGGEPERLKTIREALDTLAKENRKTVLQTARKAGEVNPIEAKGAFWQKAQPITEGGELSNEIDAANIIKRVQQKLPDGETTFDRLVKLRQNLDDDTFGRALFYDTPPASLTRGEENTLRALRGKANQYEEGLRGLENKTIRDTLGPEAAEKYIRDNQKISNILNLNTGEGFTPNMGGRTVHGYRLERGARATNPLPTALGALFDVLSMAGPRTSVGYHGRNMLRSPTYRMLMQRSPYMLGGELEE